MSVQQYFATVAKGLEELLVDELKSLGADDVKQSRSGAYFSGELDIAYKACLWSRLANHILLPIVSFEAEDQEALYAEVQKIEWLTIMRSNSTFKIDVNGQHESINNTLFIAQKMKDAIVDQIRDQKNERPSIKAHQPDVVLNAYVNKNEFSVSLSLSGESLHKRGYRLEGGIAPLRETLAAGVLMRGGWQETLKHEKPSLVDPMCGSGTLLIEAALMAYDIAPGLDRDYYGFYGWCAHNESLWSEVEEAAEAKREENLQNLKNIQVIGSDMSPRAIELSQKNIERAGLSEHIQVHKQDARSMTLEKLNIEGANSGLVLFNPPYGERLNSGEEDVLRDTFKQVGEKLKAGFEGWSLAVITSASELMKSLGIRSYKRYKMFNGALPVDLLKFNIEAASFMLFETPQQKMARMSEKLTNDPSEHFQMFCNRMRKNIKHIKRWAKREGVQCYRVYDADLPDFSMAIDLYNDENLQGYVHIQEYQAGPNVDPRKAEVRMFEALQGVHQVLDIPLENIHTKVRKKQKGENQYGKLADSMHYHAVQEGPAKLYVNFEDYLDTGLFLDHRLMRAKVAEASKGKTLLNLFAYTCSASVQAVLQGAKMVTSLDMSKTYLDWGKRNFELNKLSTKKHPFIQEDCLKWLDRNKEKFDVIFLDPPTFSNSKKMEETLDIQRDHVSLIKLAMQSLKPDGQLFFSNNFRRFKLDEALSIRHDCQNISHLCLPEDFKRRPNIHHCWVIKFK
ncbi:bifunctional 23S rRNA (guanine(2069)-N(7))-methyltransferase RlmK/23S rRNA (guanine(2445)-N(2))-methyltransferase RlmL [Francisellaceae bacterium]|nr:bifunctional 23S rRNA (guanine(2069)-N(7))-methyltransferase RlmK/23S rRNA (guanine(2445)-N(2))-methyltransferase RlmL [Francisellaceae bacterium]